MAGQQEFKGGAFFVALGIFFSRILGLIRERVFAHYFGNSSAADAFKAALRIPNVLQNLFGEGVLSGSFIPVYARLLAEGKEKEARAVSSAVASALFFVVSLVVALGVTFAPSLVAVIAPGFVSEKRELTILLTRIFFPGIGLLVASAWCLGVLNSHGKFFLSYSAPVVWNIVIILVLIAFGNDRSQDSLAIIASWGVVGGCAGQFLVQLPWTLKLNGGFSRSFSFRDGAVRQVLGNFLPILMGRGVVQISAYVDSLLASLLPTGAVAALSYSQTLYLLPIGLFGMAVSASELPTMSRLLAEPEAAQKAIRLRLITGLRRIAFFVIPSAVIFIGLGDLLISAVFETGKFTREDSMLVWKVLAAASIGLVPATLARLYASTFYALSDAKTPLKFSLLRMFISIVLGTGGALVLPGWLGLPEISGLYFLSAASAFAAVVEFLLLRNNLQRKIGFLEGDVKFLMTLTCCATLAGVAARIMGNLSSSIFLQAIVGIGAYGVIYFGSTYLLRVPECKNVCEVFRSRIGL